MSRAFTMTRSERAAAVALAVAAVTDPEYPDVTIAELGMVERVLLVGADGTEQPAWIGGLDREAPEREALQGADTGAVRLEGDDGGAEAMVIRVELVPTVLGCPALRMIEADVRAAALGAGASQVEVAFLLQPVWSPDRIAAPARQRLAQEYTITLRGRDGSLRCPLCGSAQVAERSAIGPARCRAVYYCESCRNPVEVLRK